MDNEGAPDALPIDAVPGLVWRAGPDGRCNYLSRAWLAFTGHAAGETQDPRRTTAIHPDDREHCLAQHRAALEARRPFSIEYRLRRHDGRWRWIVDHAVPWIAADGRFAGHVGCGMDIHEQRLARNELRLAVEQKSMLLAELQHRVRNTVQMVASMLTFQARRATAPEAARLLGRSARRVRSMGMAQERLFACTDPTGRVDLAPYLTELARELVVAADAGIALEAQSEKVMVLAGVAAPLGFMVSELVANALQHAFPGGRAGAIRLELRRRARVGELVIGDNGIGMPATTWPRPPELRSARIGLTLLAGLGRQAHAEIALVPADGARFRITFPLG